MRTLEDAWGWYRAVADGAKWLTHLSKHWGQLPWDTEAGRDGGLATDNVLRHVGADALGDGAGVMRAELDDLAVLVLFSVFEAAVRDLVAAEVGPAVDRLNHPALRMAGKGVLKEVEDGPFFRLTEFYKGSLDNDLIEQVNQVRQYRNWVSHGRGRRSPVRSGSSSCGRTKPTPG